MKKGRSLVELAAEIERQRDAKRDMIAPTTKLRFAQLEEGKPDQALVVGTRDMFPISPLAHSQIAEHVGIPKKYYDRMLAEAPELLATNVGEWFRKYPANRMIRTLDGRVRAFLSDGYRPLENSDLAEAIMPVLLGLNLDIMSCDITESRLYIKAVDPRIHRDVPSGRRMGDGSHVFFDTVCPALIISNSEVGLGRLSIDYGVYTKVCTNLAMIAKAGMRRTHVGAKLDVTDDLQARLSEETVRAKDKALWLEARDKVQAAFDAAQFGELCDKLAGLSQQRIEDDPIRTIELTQKRFGMTEAEGQSVLQHLIQNGDLTRYGLMSAITRAAEDLPDYDRASEFERIGGQIIDLPANDWRELAAAA